MILAAGARRVGAPYPVFLALGGALLAFLPVASTFTLPPELALALFVAPILLDAAYDTSVRDLKDNWAPVTSLVIFAVGLTTAAVAGVARSLVPAMRWAAAIALGAVVAPPDAVAAIAVLRPLRPPHRILTILEGESLLNDASALLIYRLAVGAVAATGFSVSAMAPTFLLAVAGSVAVGPVLGWITLQVMDRVEHVPTSIILQFVTTFGVWMLAEGLGLSGVLTMVCYAITVARTAPARIPAQTRIPTYAVWETAVFALNILAFIFIGHAGREERARSQAEGGEGDDRFAHGGVARFATAMPRTPRRAGRACSWISDGLRPVTGKLTSRTPWGKRPPDKPDTGSSSIQQTAVRTQIRPLEPRPAWPARCCLGRPRCASFPWPCLLPFHSSLPAPPMTAMKISAPWSTARVTPH